MQQQVQVDREDVHIGGHAELSFVVLGIVVVMGDVVVVGDMGFSLFCVDL